MHETRGRISELAGHAHHGCRVLGGTLRPFNALRPLRPYIAIWPTSAWSESIATNSFLRASALRPGAAATSSRPAKKVRCCGLGAVKPIGYSERALHVTVHRVQ